MTCQECELALGSGHHPEEHLAQCAACRALADEMRANTAAFESFADDPLPAVRHKVMAQVQSRSAGRQVLRWGWALGALGAAAAAMLAILLHSPKPQPIVQPAPEIASVEIPKTTVGPAIPLERVPVRRARHESADVLKVKMLTSDPDVVIYWLVEKKEGTE